MIRGAGAQNGHISPEEPIPMIRRMCLATMLLLVGGFVSCDFVHSAGTSSFLADARALNELSRERFGVGISALHLLVRS